MSACKRQALIEAPVESIWDLVGNPSRHPEWWPRVIEVRGERFAEGDEYAQVSHGPMGHVETTFAVDARDELRHLKVHCTKSGTYAEWALTEARGETFVDVSFGMEPVGVANRFFDVTFGRRYFRSWMDQSVKALQRAAARVPSNPM
jgi:uncharacterized protein YndB with AHSA1/START domain